MPDMLVRLYDLPDSAPYVERAASRGVAVRRADPWERERMKHFVGTTFNHVWSVEADRAFIHSPVTAYLGTHGTAIVAFAAYECSRRGFFGPMGVTENLRGSGVGAALLIRCLESMLEMGYAYAIIGGVGPAQFYEKVCGAFVIPGSEVSVYRTAYEMMQEKP